MKKTCILVALCLLLGAPQLFAEITVAVGEHEITAAGLTHGAETLFFSVGRDRVGWRSEVVRVADVITDEDYDGAVGFSVEREVPLQSVWCVVDLTTGEYALGSREGYTLKQREFPVFALQQNSRGVVDILRDDRGYAEVLFVRPSLGAWKASAGDGALHDFDGEYNGMLEIAVGDLPTFHGPARSGPDFLEPGDMLLVVSPRSLEFFAARYQPE